MNKMLMFVFLVLAGVFGVLFMLNQNNPSQKEVQGDKTIDLTTPEPTSPSVKSTLSTSVSPEPSISTSETSSQTATIKTSKGDIVLILYPEVAPNTVKNFVDKGKSGFYNNLTFHRVEDWVIQGGDPSGNGTGGGNMPVEFNSKPFVVGSMGVASRGDGKVQNDAQFFITKKDASWLNGQYTNFGIVKEGMDVVNEMEIGDKILRISVE